MRTLLIALLIICTGCRSSKKQNKEVVDLKYKFEKTDFSFIRKDTIVDFRPSKQSQRNSIALSDTLYKDSGLDSDISRLETQYAISTAQILNGKLIHTIENKDSIPQKIVYIEKKSTSSDIDKTDKNSTESKVIEKERFGEEFFYFAGVLASILFCIVIFLSLFRLKVKLWP